MVIRITGEVCDADIKHILESLSGVLKIRFEFEKHSSEYTKKGYLDMIKKRGLMRHSNVKEVIIRRM